MESRFSDLEDGYSKVAVKTKGGKYVHISAMQ